MNSGSGLAALDSCLRLPLSSLLTFCAKRESEEQKLNHQTPGISSSVVFLQMFGMDQFLCDYKHLFWASNSLGESLDIGATRFKSQESH